MKASNSHCKQMCRAVFLNMMEVCDRFIRKMAWDPIEKFEISTMMVPMA